MPVTLTKAELHKILVAERAKARTKAKQSLFMRRTLSIYNGQKIRYAEWRQSLPAAARPAADLPYTLAELRAWAEYALRRGTCCHCYEKLTIKKLTPDHARAIADGGSWTLKNLVASCQSCNWQKGRLSAQEFRQLLRFCAKYLSKNSAIDLKRRLSIGGRWSPK